MYTTPPRSKGFETLDEELEVGRLELDGELPDWLRGTLVRVTPAMLDVGGEPLRHWFDGIAMLNGFSFGGGRVGYGSRFLRTEAYASAKSGEIGFIGFAQDPCRSLFKRTMALFGANPNDNCNVNVAALGDRYIAMTETPLPVEFDARTLETVGVVRWRDRVGGHISTAHPHFDFDRREAVGYVARLSARSSYRIFAVPESSTRRRLIGTIPVREPGYMHSFAMTARYVVLMEFPLVVDPLRLATGGRALIDNYRWEPDRGTRLLVMDRATGRLEGIYEAPACFAFHHVNAFERGRELVIDLCVHETGPTAIEALEVERLRGAADPVRPTRLTRYVVPLDGRPATSERLADVDVELPRIDYRRRNTRDYRYVYAAGFRTSGSDWFDAIAKVDVASGDALTWAEVGCYPGEPVFVAAPGEEAEDAGVLLSVVLDAEAGRSFLLVLDAASLTERARASVPHRIPFGFHGQYFAETR